MRNSKNKERCEKLSLSKCAGVWELIAIKNARKWCSPNPGDFFVTAFASYGLSPFLRIGQIFKNSDKHGCVSGK